MWIIKRIIELYNLIEVGLNSLLLGRPATLLLYEHHLEIV